MPFDKFVQGETLMRMMVWSAVAAFALASAGVASAQQAETPRKGRRPSA